MSDQPTDNQPSTDTQPTSADQDQEQKKDQSENELPDADQNGNDQDKNNRDKNDQVDDQADGAQSEIDTEIDTDQPPEVPEVQEVEVENPNLIQIANEDNDKAHWYVVHTYSGREKKVAETLKQRAQTLDLTDKIIKVLIPTKEKIQIRKGKRKTVNEKIFPGYMLVNMLMSDDAWLAVRTTNGVTGFVGTSSKPSPLPRHEVESIMQYMQQATPQYKTDFTEGQAVRITDGPFNDFLGTVQAIDEDKGQVEVLINIFGRETPVELDFLQVEKV